jgi:hypothetical protein
MASDDPVPAPGDVLAWDEVAGAMQQAAEWLHSYAHGDALVVVPENYRRVAEVLSRASLGRLAARPTPMTEEEVHRIADAAGFMFGWGRAQAVRMARAFEAHHGIAHPSPAGAGDAPTTTTTQET